MMGFNRQNYNYFLTLKYIRGGGQHLSSLLQYLRHHEGYHFKATDVAYNILFFQMVPRRVLKPCFHILFSMIFGTIFFQWYLNTVHIKQQFWKSVIPFQNGSQISKYANFNISQNIFQPKNEKLLSHWNSQFCSWKQNISTNSLLK